MSEAMSMQIGEGKAGGAFVIAPAGAAEPGRDGPGSGSVLN
jgi:hypothetical protein